MKLLKLTFIFAFIFAFINVNAQSGEYNTKKQGTFVASDTWPKYPGGDKARLSFLIENITYPEEAIESEEFGTVFVGFVVEKDGSITNVKLIRSVSPSLDKEALRVIKKMPKWSPGIKDGKLVRAKFTMPVIFVLKVNTQKIKRQKKRALRKKQKLEAKAKKE